MTNLLRQLRRDPALVAIVLAGGLAAGLLVAVLSGHAADRSTATIATAATITTAATPVVGHSLSLHSPAHSPVSSATGPVMAGRGESPPRVGLGAALDSGVHRADELGGEAAAAVWVSGDAQPVLSGPVTTPHRMWSMSKAVVSIAALQAAGNEPDPVLRSALTNAIRRSDNCAIRRVIVGLQDRLNGGLAGTVAAFEQVLASAGASIETTPQAAAAEQTCVRYLDRNRGELRGGDLGVAPQFGTAEWTEVDAISFTHALTEGVYAPGAYLLRLMEQPKEPPLEEPPPPSAPPLDWGAGMAFPTAWHPAWKAGWGGSRDHPPHFLAGQIVVLRLPRTPVAAAALFVPKAEPATDNPGLTQAPLALEFMFDAVRAGLEGEHIGMNGAVHAISNDRAQALSVKRGRR